MTVQHASQFLFTSAHPLTSEFELNFESCVDHVLSVSVKAPSSFADVRDKTKVHSSFTTLFLDTVMGSCVLGELDKLMPIATVNLTVNHLERAKVGEQITCHAHFHGQIHDVAHVSCRLEGEGAQNLLATGTGTFMIGTRSRPLGETAHENTMVRKT